MLPCIVIDLFLNKQPDALIIQILFCYKTLHAWKRSSETGMKITSAECTVENS